MDKTIGVGYENFSEFIRDNNYYVDKTELIYDLVARTKNKVTLFTRPRRFGKTMTMSMIENFFDCRRVSKDVFENWNIYKNYPEFCADWMNQYPVLFLSLKDVEGRNYNLAYGKFRILIADLCKKHEYLGSKQEINPFDRDIFLRLQANKASEDEIQNSLKTIMRMMNAVYGKPVILLIDEYDVPLAKAHENGFYQKMLDVIRGFMSTSFKTNDYLKFAVVTGCLRIPKESIFTGVNNFASYSVLDEDFSEYFGFTSDEVKKILIDYDRAEKIAITRDWYDGYLFGDTQIYCPWDVVSYVSALRRRENAKPGSYWENTSGHGAIKAFFDMENVDVSDKFEALLNGKTITENIMNALTYENAYESESNLWSILLMTGYLTAVNQGRQDEPEDEDTRIIETTLRIPNQEIATIFQRAVVDHFNRSVDNSRINELMQAMWNGEEDKASEILSDLLWHTISYMDYHEDYYHAFVAGIFTGRGGYAVRSNKERGLGRPDIDLRDKKNRRAMIIEAKKAENRDRMEYWCEEGIRQIIDNEYAKDLDGYNQVLCYGISFYKKSALVKLMK